MKTLVFFTVIPLLAQLTLADSTGTGGASSSTSELTTSQLVSKANALLSTGQASKALELYELVLERNPDDYLTLYKKATTHMSLGHYNQASNAFQKVLSLKDFDKARIQLSKIHLKLGSLDACEEELKTYLKSTPASPEADALKTQSDLEQVKKHVKSARSHHKSKKWDKCVEESTLAIQHSPQSVQLRELRAECHMMLGHLQEAVGDLTRVAQLSPNSALPSLRLSMVSYFFLGEPLDKSITPIKQCLHSDPESKPCKKMFRLLKSVEKDLSKVKNFMNSKGYRSAIKILKPKGVEDEGLIVTIENTIKSSQSTDSKSGITEPLISPTLTEVDRYSNLLTTLYSYICKAYIGLNEITASQAVCEALYKRDDQDAWGLVSKAELLMKQEEWEEAVKILNKAYESSGNDEDIGSRLQKAQKGLKVSKQKDYYKVLGVPRDVDAKTLKKAYRKATLKAHPDKGGSQAKMTALNEAYEVLSNPELRARYDNGDDPNDPMSGQGGFHGNPFQGGNANPIFQQFFQQQAGGGNPFGGSSGGQTFSFRWG